MDPSHLKQHSGKPNRFQTDVTDEKSKVIELHVPGMNLAGRPRRAFQYVASIMLLVRRIARVS